MHTFPQSVGKPKETPKEERYAQTLRTFCTYFRLIIALIHQLPLLHFPFQYVLIYLNPRPGYILWV